MFSDDFEFVKIATDKMQGGDNVLDELKKDRDGGMPWMVILDGDGEEVICSSGPNGNVGCPVTEEEIDYFVEMIKKSSDQTPEQLAAIKAAMNEFGKKHR